MPYQPVLELDQEAQTDYDIEKVRLYFCNFKDLVERSGQAIRKAIDTVIAGRYTGRYSVDQLDKTEKTYIGTKVEHYILRAFRLPKMQQIDTRINGIKVDVKFSIRSEWSIPQEAVGEICLVISADDNASTFDMGLLRTTEGVLNMGLNRDRKRTVNREGKRKIKWLIKGGPLPRNVLLHLSPEVREAILAKPSGQQRITEFFRQCHGIVVNGTVTETLAAQKDSSKRVRDARDDLRSEGIAIYSHFDNDLLSGLGHGPLKVGEFIALCNVEESSHDSEPRSLSSRDASVRRTESTPRSQATHH